MDDSEYREQTDPLIVPGVANMGLGGGQMPGSFGTTGRGPRLLTGGGPRATAISTASTIVVIAALVAVFWLAPGSAQVRHTFFDVHDMWQSFVGNPKQGYYSVGEAIWLNIRMFLAAEVLILIVALVIALVRQSTSPVLFPLRVLAVIYVDFFRGVPLLLVIFAVGFGVPALALPFVSKLPLAVYGVAALVLSYSAYVSEVYRAGLNSVHRSQVAAARSLGLSHPAAMRYVILPQAVRNIVPPLLNDFISLQKDTALVGVLGAIEANNAAQIYGSTVFNYSSFTVAAILFLLLTIPLARFTDHLIDRDRRRRLAGATT
jgi:polar amino acid transport system permease protein